MLRSTFRSSLVRSMLLRKHASKNQARARRVRAFLIILFAMVGVSCVSGSGLNSNDLNTKAPFLELEEVDGKGALEWVSEQNLISKAHLETGTLYPQLKKDAFDIIDAKDRIPTFSIRTYRGEKYVVNFWQDQDHQKGIVRRQTLQAYQGVSDVWETVIDIDQIAKEEKKNWVFKGSSCAPSNKEICLVELSDGGGDATYIREYDLGKKSFVKGGFEIPMAKSQASWIDDDTLLVGSDWGPDTVSTSGYALTLRLYERGEDLKKAKEVFRGRKTDMLVFSHVFRKEGVSSGKAERQLEKPVIIFERSLGFYEADYFFEGTTGIQIKLDFPRDTKLFSLTQGQLTFTTKKSDTVFGAKIVPGDLYSVSYKDLAVFHEARHEFGQNQSQSGKKPSVFPQIHSVFSVKSHQALNDVLAVKGALVISYLDQVMPKLGVARYNFQEHKWIFDKIEPKVEKYDSILFGGAADSEESLFTISTQGYLSPSKLYVAEVPQQSRVKQHADYGIKLLRSTPARFRSHGMKVEAHQATSKDGTKIPYFLIMPEMTAQVKEALKQKAVPTIINAYGGFEVAKFPYYGPIMGKLWLERGGAYVVANIRGGGEFGPKWHQAALREKRQNAFDDLFSVTEDLIKRGITSPQHLGMVGGSNGGLLAGVALTQRPDLYKAIAIQVPLLDMLRYHKLLAGASWMAEYGNPDDPDDRKFIEAYSPMQNVKKDKDYPEAFFMTSTRDDRVHPGHARRMVALLKEMGKHVLYYENMEGGHAGAALNESRAEMQAREYAYFIKKLMK